MINISFEICVIYLAGGDDDVLRHLPENMNRIGLNHSMQLRRLKIEKKKNNGLFSLIVIVKFNCLHSDSRSSD